MSDNRDPIHVQTYRDADAAFPMAQALWKEAGLTPPPDVLQATVATLLIHMKDLRKAPSPQAGRAVPAAPGRPAPSPAPAVQVPSCPVCGGEMWDNRTKKTNPKAPDFRCKDKECKDEKGYTPGLWVKDLKKNTPRAQAHARPVPTVANGGFDERPEGLDGEDDLPF